MKKFIVFQVMFIMAAMPVNIAQMDNNSDVIKISDWPINWEICDRVRVDIFQEKIVGGEYIEFQYDFDGDSESLLKIVLTDGSHIADCHYYENEDGTITVQIPQRQLISFDRYFMLDLIFVKLQQK